MFEVWSDIDIMIECFTPVVVQMGAIIKVLNFMIDRRKVIKSFVFQNFQLFRLMYIPLVFYLFFTERKN